MGITCTRQGGEIISANHQKLLQSFQDPNGGEELDDRLPLDKTAKYNVKRLWKQITRHMRETGVTTFIRMFEMNSDVLSLFQKQIGSSENIEELRNNKVLEGHVLMVMHTLDEAFSNLNDLDFVIEMLHAVGRTHKKMPMFTADVFWKIEDPFLVAVKETLGDRYTSNVETIYQMTIKFILATLGEGIKGVGLV